MRAYKPRHMFIVEVGNERMTCRFASTIIDTFRLTSYEQTIFKRGIRDFKYWSRKDGSVRVFKGTCLDCKIDK